VLIVAVIFLAGGFVTLVVWAATRGRAREIDERIIWPEGPSATRAQVMGRVARRLTAARYHVDARTDWTITITRTFSPAWTIVAAILLFPLGLPALLVKGALSSSVTLTPAGGGTTEVVARGLANPAAETVFADLRDAADAARAGRPPS
jgi:hypothetical protein